MKRFRIVAAVTIVLLFAVFLAGAAWHTYHDAPISPIPLVSTVSAAGALDGPAGWRYRYSQPTNWRSCMLQP